jgi:HSP20 family protein
VLKRHQDNALLDQSPRERSGGVLLRAKEERQWLYSPILLMLSQAFSRLWTPIGRAVGWTRASAVAAPFRRSTCFAKAMTFVIIAKLPGVKKSDLDVQVKGRTVRLAGERTVGYPEKAALHRRERLAGRFDRAVTMPIEINPDGVKAEYRDGILALFLPRAESDKPKSIKVA